MEWGERDSERGCDQLWVPLRVSEDETFSPGLLCVASRIPLSVKDGSCEAASGKCVSDYGCLVSCSVRCQLLRLCCTPVSMTDCGRGERVSGEADAERRGCDCGYGRTQCGPDRGTAWLKDVCVGRHAVARAKPVIKAAPTAAAAAAASPHSGGACWLFAATPTSVTDCCRQWRDSAAAERLCKNKHSLSLWLCDNTGRAVNLRETEYYVKYWAPSLKSLACAPAYLQVWSQWRCMTRRRFYWLFISIVFFFSTDSAPNIKKLCV